MENVRDWMYLPRRLPEFETGVTEFLNVSFAKAAKGDQICCPCKRCKNRYWYRRDEVFDHLKGYGFVENYYVWVFHGENRSTSMSNNVDDDDGAGMHDNFDELLHDRFRDIAEETDHVQEGLNEEAKKFYKLVEEGKQELFPGCKNFTKLSFIIRLFLYKTLHGLSNVAFDDLLQLLQETIPEAKLPASFTKAKSIVRDLGLDYKKIPACPNDCMLYWKEYAHVDTCHICHTSKWKQLSEKEGSKPNNEHSKKTSKVPAKVVWHFPLKPRLQRLFMCSETAKYMTWHDEGRPKDGYWTIEISKLKKRGPTMMHAVHTRKFNERETIICNEFGQPVGPVTKENDVVERFSRFLGTIARTHSYAPLIHKSWHKVPNKDKIWEYVLEKCNVPNDARTWVLSTIGHAYKVYKCRFKKKHFYQLKDNKTRWKNRPKSIPEKDFSQLLNLWNNKSVAKRCLRAKEIRMSQKNMHTAGPKSFARIRDEMKNDDPNKELPTLTQMFERTRKRTEGRAYVDSYDDTARKIEQMKNYKPQEDGSASVDPFMVVMNKENDGYRRLYGRGVTNRLIKKMDGGDTSYMISGGLMETFKANVEVENNRLLEMRKEIEEDHERKKAELEAMRKDIDNQREDFEAMRKDLENQRQNFEATVRKLMTQLPLGGQEFLT